MKGCDRCRLEKVFFIYCLTHVMFIMGVLSLYFSYSLWQIVLGIVLISFAVWLSYNVLQVLVNKTNDEKEAGR